MTKCPPLEDDDIAKENEYDIEEDEADISGVMNGYLSFPGAQYFNEIMHQKKQSKKVAKFRVPRKLDSDF